MERSNYLYNEQSGFNSIDILINILDEFADRNHNEWVIHVGVYNKNF